MASTAKVFKFESIDKKHIRGKMGHSRTGACTSKGKCNHGTIKFGRIQKRGKR